MVGADRGGVHVAHAVGQHGNARAFLAADDRAADAGAEEGALYARQLGHGIAQGAGLLLVQALTGQHVHRARQGFGIALQRRRGDLYRGEFGQVAVTVGGVLAGCKGDGRQQGGEGQGQGMRLEPRGVGGHGQVLCYNVSIAGRTNPVEGTGGGKTVRFGEGCYIIP